MQVVIYACMRVCMFFFRFVYAVTYVSYVCVHVCMCVPAPVRVYVHLVVLCLACMEFWQHQKFVCVCECTHWNVCSCLSYCVFFVGFLQQH